MLSTCLRNFSVQNVFINKQVCNEKYLMEVNNLPILKVNRFNSDANTPARLFGVSCPNLSPLKQDTVSFKGAVLKKTDFKGTDFAVIEIYKINPQQLKSKEDLQTVAESKINEIKEKDFGGRQEETRIQRKAMLKEWFDYVIKENDEYLIFNSPKNGISIMSTKDFKSFKNIRTLYLNQENKPWAKDRITAGFVIDVSGVSPHKYAMFYHGDNEDNYLFGASLAVAFSDDLTSWYE